MKSEQYAGIDVVDKDRKEELEIERELKLNGMIEFVEAKLLQNENQMLDKLGSDLRSISTAGLMDNYRQAETLSKLSDYLLSIKRNRFIIPRERAKTMAIAKNKANQLNEEDAKRIAADEKEKPKMIIAE